MPGDQGGCQASGGGQGWGFEGGGGSAQARRVHSSAASILMRAPALLTVARLPPPRESVHTLRIKSFLTFSVKHSLLAASLPPLVIPACALAPLAHRCPPLARSLAAPPIPLACLSRTASPGHIHCTIHVISAPIMLSASQVRILLVLHVCIVPPWANAQALNPRNATQHPRLLLVR